LELNHGQSIVVLRKGTSVPAVTYWTSLDSDSGLVARQKMQTESLNPVIEQAEVNAQFVGMKDKDHE
jgi:hypothetical protein